MPLTAFGQETAYAAHGAGQWLGYALTVAGWVLATTAATGITRALARP